jgi:hypothetical protein
MSLCRLATDAAPPRTYRVSDPLQCPHAIEKGKPVARRGRKACGPLGEVAGLPKRREGRVQGCDQHEEWEPGGALTGALEGMSLLPGAERDEDLARLEPHVGEALGALERLERRRGLSEREKARMGALRMLLASIEGDR